MCYISGGGWRHSNGRVVAKVFVSFITRWLSVLIMILNISSLCNTTRPTLRQLGTVHRELTVYKGERDGNFKLHARFSANKAYPIDRLYQEERVHGVSNTAVNAKLHTSGVPSHGPSIESISIVDRRWTYCESSLIVATVVKSECRDHSLALVG